MGIRILLVAVLAVGALGYPAEESSDTLGTGMRVLYRVYSDCSQRSSTLPCLKMKAVTFMNRALRLPEISLADSVTLVKDPSENEVGTDRDGRTLAASEAELEATLPNDEEAKDAALDEMLLDRVSRFAKTHTLQLKLPQLSPSEIKHSLEGRGKKLKKMGGMLIAGVVAKLAALIPLAILFLFLLAGKALIVSKVALLLAGVIALKKLFASRPAPSEHGSGGWANSLGGFGGGGIGGGGFGGGGFGGGGSGGLGGGAWAGDRRSLEEHSHRLAYGAQIAQS